MTKHIEEKDLPKINELAEKILGKKIDDIKRLGGLTNHSYKVTLSDEKSYVIRIPGEGTEELIVRSDEKISTNLACSLNIDAKLLYFGDDGSKVSEYIDNAVTMSAKTMRERGNIEKAAAIFKKLHTCSVDTKVPFNVFDMACGYEKIIKDYKVSMYTDYDSIKNQISQIKKDIDSSCNIELVPCHNDPLCENWVLSNERLYLIDWEYAGMNDGYWDIADVSIEADFDYELDMYILECYLNHKPTKTEWNRFMANKLYVDYLWTLWAKARVPFDGEPMENWAKERYIRLKHNLEAL